nr:hypothetical protein [Tanacetum cinerariifolium]
LKRQNVTRVYNMRTCERKPYSRNLPKYTKCHFHHNGLCTQKCHKCNKVGHFARDCRSSGNPNVANAQKNNGANPKGNGCFECGASGHFKRDYPKLKNKDGEKVKENNVSAYTEHFQELTLICTKFVAHETEKIDKYVSGLHGNIYGSVKASKPKTLDETIELANDLMD